MKKKKLSLDQLKVNSFVTGLEDGKKQTAKGGNGLSEPYTVCCFEDDSEGCTGRLRCISYIPYVC